MKRLAFLSFLMLPILATAQLQFQPKPVSTVVYPGNPLSLPITVSGTAPMPIITATLRYGQGGLVALPADQPSLITLGRTATISWAHYSAQPSVQYLEIGVNGMTQIAVTIQAIYNAPQVSSPTSITINPTGALPITLSLNGGGSGGISVGDLGPLLAAKASRDSVYAKTATDNLLAQRVAVTQYNADMVSLISSIGLKAGISDVYTKTVSDVRYKAIGYVPAWSEVTGKPPSFSGAYTDLTGKPTIPTVPSLVSAFTNDAGYQTGTQVGTAISNATISPVQVTPDATHRWLTDALTTTWNAKLDASTYASNRTTDQAATTAAQVTANSANTGLASHTSNTSNPHGTTAAQVGAYTTSQTDNLILLRLPVAHVTNKTGLLASATGAAHWIETDLDSDFGSPSVSLWDGTKLLTFPTLTR